MASKKKAQRLRAIKLLQWPDARSAKGLALLLRCVASGDTTALSTLGSLAFYKWPPLEPKRLAYACYSVAAEFGDLDGMYNMASALIEGAGTKQDVSRGVALLRNARRLGSAEAAQYLGFCLRMGIGCRRDLRKSFQMILEAARKGIIDAQYDVGVLLFYGNGVKKDQKRGVEWINRAALGGDQKARRFLRARGSRLPSAVARAERLARLQKEI